MATRLLKMTVLRSFSPVFPVSRSLCLGCLGHAPRSTFHTDSETRLFTNLSRIQFPHKSRTFDIIASSTNRTFTSLSHSSFSDTGPSSRDTESFPDPDRPDLFYHLFYPPTPLSSTAAVYAVSFLPYAPKLASSKTIIGWLPASTGAGEDGAGLNDFEENPSFRELLHEALQSGLKDDVDEIQRNGAIQTQQGWMHINDNRNVPALGRIGDPDDILASVRVEEGKILVDTYQPMPSYRLCTSDGILKLSDGLAARLREHLDAETIRENAITTS